MRVACVVPLERIQDHAIGIKCMMSLVAQLMNLSANVASTELCHQCGFDGTCGNWMGCVYRRICHLQCTDKVSC